MVMDLAKGGLLFSLLKGEHDYWRNLPLNLKMHSLTGVVSAVSYMHSMGCIHADLKPQNLLLASKMEDRLSEPTFWVSDFGLAATTNTVTTSMGSAFNPPREGSNTCVIPGYMAPETILDSEITEQSGVFSLASTLWSALSSDIPFRRVADILDYKPQLIENGKRPSLSELPGGVPDSICKLLEKAWMHNPSGRPLLTSFWTNGWKRWKSLPSPRM
eukprot:gb/GECG01006178.1/.p1 GENE.gb/GECG01006178.1/~~gb/GECG01006178.1/.p1  ORF type:complete len:216 (+),score=16.42 gb/GECG01006178.1/:1-648(+)